MDTFYKDNKVYFTQKVIKFIDPEPYSIFISKAKAGNIILHYKASWPKMSVEITKSKKIPNLYFVKSNYQITHYGSDFRLTQESFEPIDHETFYDMKKAIEAGEFQFSQFNG